MKTQNLNSVMICALIHLIKNQLEKKRKTVGELSQYTTKTVRESFNKEIEELINVQDTLEKMLIKPNK